MAIGGIFTALFGVAGISLVALSHGIPLRAGLDIGLGLTNMFPNELYGPAMVKAYTLESKVARYPRAVLGSTLLDYLSVVEHLAPTDPVSKYAVLQAQDSRKLVCTDPDDGQSMLHVLSPLLFELMPDYKKYRGPAEAWVNEQALLFRKQKNDELAVRYSRLARYFGRYPSA
jgi:hypothetical protein